MGIVAILKRELGFETWWHAEKFRDGGAPRYYGRVDNRHGSWLFAEGASRRKSICLRRLFLAVMGG